MEEAQARVCPHGVGQLLRSNSWRTRIHWVHWVHWVQRCQNRSVGLCRILSLSSCGRQVRSLGNAACHATPNGDWDARLGYPAEIQATRFSFTIDLTKQESEIGPAVRYCVGWGRCNDALTALVTPLVTRRKNMPKPCKTAKTGLASATEASNGSADSKSVAKAHTLLDISLRHVAVAMCGKKSKQNVTRNSGANAGDTWNMDEYGDVQIEGDTMIL